MSSLPQVYTHQVDVFSFGMLLYEAITLHIPYENLNGQQANQANERGSRPPLTKKVLGSILRSELFLFGKKYVNFEKTMDYNIIIIGGG